MDAETTVAGCGILTIVLAVLFNLAFWGILLFVFLHFVAKVW